MISVGSILAAWKHTTTLYVTIYEGSAPDESAVRALGIMHIGLTDVHHLLAHAEVLNVNRAERERYLVRFVAMFARSIWPFYGGALNELGRFPVDLEPDYEPDGVASRAQEALGRRRSRLAVRSGRPVARLGGRPRRVLTVDPLSRRDQGPGDAGVGFRHVGDVDADPDHPPQPRRAPPRRGIRRVAVRLSSRDRPPVGRHAVHRGRHRLPGLAPCRRRGAAGDRGAIRCRCSATAWDRCRC